MMAPSPDCWARLCADPLVRPTVDLHGPESPYVADVVIRSALQIGHPWLLDAGAAGTIIRGGIGTLTITADGMVFDPTLKTTPAAPKPATPDQVATRLAICRACRPHWDGAKCTVAGCGCSGAGFIERAYSRCPIGSWSAAATL